MLLPTPLAQDQALRALAEIRSVVDRSTRYSTFSALSGCIAAAASLTGSGLCGYFGNFAGARPENGMRFVSVWAIVLVVAAIAQIVLTTIKARRRGEAVFTPIARTAFTSMAGASVAGVLASLVFIATERWTMLPGLWLTMYGCALWSVSFFAPLFLRVLGVLYMFLGLCAWGAPQFSALWLGLGFGVLHLIFASIVMARYQK